MWESCVYYLCAVHTHSWRMWMLAPEGWVWTHRTMLGRHRKMTYLHTETHTQTHTGIFIHSETWLWAKTFWVQNWKQPRMWLSCVSVQFNTAQQRVCGAQHDESITPTWEWSLSLCVYLQVVSGQRPVLTEHQSSCPAPQTDALRAGPAGPGGFCAEVSASVGAWHSCPHPSVLFWKQRPRLQVSTLRDVSWQLGAINCHVSAGPLVKSQVRLPSVPCSPRCPNISLKNPWKHSWAYFLTSQSWETPNSWIPVVWNWSMDGDYGTEPSQSSSGAGTANNWLQNALGTLLRGQQCPAAWVGWWSYYNICQNASNCTLTNVSLHPYRGSCQYLWAAQLRQGPLGHFHGDSRPSSQPHHQLPSLHAILSSHTHVIAVLTCAVTGQGCYCAESHPHFQSCRCCSLAFHVLRARIAGLSGSQSNHHRMILQSRPPPQSATWQALGGKGLHLPHQI